MKIRLDKLLVDRGLVGSRERASAMVLAGRVLVEEQKVVKPGTPIETEAAIRLLGDDLRYVSRGGLKLEKALSHWKIDLNGAHCTDIGTSTGGFTDCMLQHGAATVLAVDTGYGQIADRLRRDPRVSLRERTNARLLGAGELIGSTPAQRVRSLSPVASEVQAEPQPGDAEGKEPSGDAEAEELFGVKVTQVAAGPITFFAMDVSFISASLVIPAVIAALAPVGEHWTGSAVVLIKPQFEAGREHVGKGGIVRDPAARRIAIDRVCETVVGLGGTVVEVIDSPIRGMEGNHEYLCFAHFRRDVGEA
jgi:23S rRNA (cytidine1920-2'-O)/16S rRNA (cytidine1409-2'-O)-methyltransferase